MHSLESLTTGPRANNSFSHSETLSTGRSYKVTLKLGQNQQSRGRDPLLSRDHRSSAPSPSPGRAGTAFVATTDTITFDPGRPANSLQHSGQVGHAPHSVPSVLYFEKSCVEEVLVPYRLSCHRREVKLPFHSNWPSCCNMPPRRRVPQSYIITEIATPRRSARLQGLDPDGKPTSLSNTRSRQTNSIPPPPTNIERGPSIIAARGSPNTLPESSSLLFNSGVPGWIDGVQQAQLMEEEETLQRDLTALPSTVDILYNTLWRIQDFFGNNHTIEPTEVRTLADLQRLSWFWKLLFLWLATHSAVAALIWFADERGPLELLRDCSPIPLPPLSISGLPAALFPTYDGTLTLTKTSTRFIVPTATVSRTWSTTLTSTFYATTTVVYHHTTTVWPAERTVTLTRGYGAPRVRTSGGGETNREDMVSNDIARLADEAVVDYLAPLIRAQARKWGLSTNEGEGEIRDQWFSWAQDAWIRRELPMDLRIEPALKVHREAMLQEKVRRGLKNGENESGDGEGPQETPKTQKKNDHEQRAEEEEEDDDDDASARARAKIREMMEKAEAANKDKWAERNKKLGVKAEARDTNREKGY